MPLAQFNRIRITSMVDGCTQYFRRRFSSESCYVNETVYCVVVAPTVYPKKYAHGFVVLCFVVVMQSFIMNSHEVFIHIYQGCFAGTGAIVRLPQCQWSKPDGYGKISQCITTTKHSKAKTVCIFLGIYCMMNLKPTSPFSVFVDIMRTEYQIIIECMFVTLYLTHSLPRISIR